ncbi:MAG: hypothetical protein WCS89_03560 [Candidatus Paceibacterota bacterium]|jgi:hypothetical protein
MRHTLLPLQERIVLRREYYKRIVLVLSLTLSLAIFVGMAFLAPTFIRALSTEREVGGNTADVSKGSNNNDLKNVQQSFARSLVMMNSLKEGQGSPRISELVNEVVGIRETVRFNSFIATKVSTTTFTMVIQGVSPTRNALLAFKSNFESMAVGNKVELPVSELAKSSNIQFSLKLNKKLK